MVSPPIASRKQNLARAATPRLGPDDWWIVGRLQKREAAEGAGGGMTSRDSVTLSDGSSGGGGPAFVLSEAAILDHHFDRH
jgi:hypothetical protein